MKRHRAFSTLAAGVLTAGLAAAQTPPTASAVPRLVRLSGTANEAPDHLVSGITFALYSEQTGGAPLWMETQNAQVGPGGHYSVLLGSTKPEGLPAALFASEQPHWLGIAVEDQVEQPRMLLVSAPYALKAGDAETLGGLPPSAFIRAPTTSSSGEEKTVAARDVSPDAGCAKITSDVAATANQVAKFTAPCTVEPSAVFESGGKVGVGTTTPAATLDVNGAATIRSTLTMNAKGTATAAAGANSNSLDLLAASFAGATETSISQHFRWQAEAAGNDTAIPAGSLNLLYAPGSAAPAETGLSVSTRGALTFSPGQTFPGAGSITGITVSSGLAGGGISGTVPIGLTDACAVGELLRWNGANWVCAAAGVGTITGVTAGAGLSGGGSSGNVTLANTGVLAVSGGAGINSSGGNAPAVSLNTGYTDARYAQLMGGALSGGISLPANGLSAAGNQLALAGGSVGMGTGTPGAPLEVAGKVKIGGAGSALTFPDGTTQTTAGYPVGVNPLRVALLKWFPAYQSSANFAAGNKPVGVVFDGANIWVSNGINGGLRKLQASTGAVLETYSVYDPVRLAFDGAYIWAVNVLSNSVTKLLASTGASVGTYSVGNRPWGITFDGTNIWVVNNGDNTVTKLLAANGTLQGTYPVGKQPYEIAYDGANIWVTNYRDGSLTKIQASSGTVLGTFNLGIEQVNGLAFDGTYIWVSNGSTLVTKVLASTGEVVGAFSAGGYTSGVLFDGANIWVTNGVLNTVTKLAPSTGAILGTFTVGSSPWSMAFDGANVWVANTEGNTVSKL